jgi:large subunit ribosomal protein L17
MRHHNTNRKFGRTKDVRIAFLRSLARNLIRDEAIETTVARAKEIRPLVEKLVTQSKNDSVANRRLVAAKLGNAESETAKLFTDLGPRYKERPGGYLRIIKTRMRKGDGATMAHISFV